MSESVEYLRAQLEDLQRRMAVRDAEGVSRTMLDSLRAAGYPIADAAAAEVLVKSAALACPTDPASAALDLARKHPGVFGQLGDKTSDPSQRSTEERADFLRSSGILSGYPAASSPTAGNRSIRAAAVAAARSKPPEEQTAEERQMILRSKGIV